MGRVLETAAADDAEALYELECLSHTHPWTAAHMAAALQDTARATVFVLREHPRAARRGILAYCVVAWAADEAHVHNLAVDPAWRSRGLGRWLLAQVLSAARRRGARAAYLEVRAGNEPALRLYRAAGFRQLQVRSGYYRQPAEDALILAKELD